MSNPCVWVVIPSFNALAVTRSCLGDLADQTYPNIMVILSDSGSTDGTCEAVAQEFPDVVIIQGKPDWWWTKATNEGVQYALSRSSVDDYIITLNNDVGVPLSYLAAMVGMIQRYPQSIIGSVIYDAAERSKLVECGSYIDWRTMK